MTWRLPSLKISSTCRHCEHNNIWKCTHQIASQNQAQPVEELVKYYTTEKCQTCTCTSNIDCGAYMLAVHIAGYIVRDHTECVIHELHWFSVIELSAACTTVDRGAPDCNISSCFFKYSRTSLICTSTVWLLRLSDAVAVLVLVAVHAKESVLFLHWSRNKLFLIALRKENRKKNLPVSMGLDAQWSAT